MNHNIRALLLALTCCWACGDDDSSGPERTDTLPVETADAGSPDAASQDARVDSTDGRVDLSDARLPTHSDSDADTPDAGPFTGEVETAAMGESNGGFPVPVWLYRGGISPTDLDGLLPIPAEALKFRAANPDLWRSWRRTSEGVQLKNAKGVWYALAYDDEYAALPKGTTLNATYGQDQNIYQTIKYRFASDGTFKYCEYTSLVSGGSRSSGTYQIDGYVIRLRYTDGTSATFSFVHDPKDRPNTLWIDQSPYKRINTESASTALSCS